VIDDFCMFKQEELIGDNKVDWLAVRDAVASACPVSGEQVRIGRPVEVHWIVQGPGIDLRSVGILQR